uniref:Uncharacterized protein n=1 Tax=Haptolina ericina TaxID=156174 RepID=A0A7S3ARW5_9EUKA|mmetsp:Transcript_32375/g.73088  ORF Transcript_32375/g.73088 Transcript_32375/m.73088 type:complete len:213 (+) Transcript_32375:53-691(+)
MGSAPSSDAQNDEALFYATAHGDSEAVTELIAAAANVNHIQRDQDMATPAIAAAQEGNKECLRLLLEQPTLEIDRADQWGYAPCHMACKWGHPECLSLILAAGADPSCRTKDGATACHVAAEHDQVECLRSLVAAGANVELLCHGSTPYDVAVESGSEACIEYLEHVLCRPVTGMAVRRSARSTGVASVSKTKRVLSHLATSRAASVSLHST